LGKSNNIFFFSIVLQTGTKEHGYGQQRKQAFDFLHSNRRLIHCKSEHFFNKVNDKLNNMLKKQSFLVYILLIMNGMRKI